MTGISRMPPASLCTDTAWAGTLGESGRAQPEQTPVCFVPYPARLPSPFLQVTSLGSQAPAGLSLL